MFSGYLHINLNKKHKKWQKIVCGSRTATVFIIFLHYLIRTQTAVFKALYSPVPLWLWGACAGTVRSPPGRCSLLLGWSCLLFGPRSGSSCTRPSWPGLCSHRISSLLFGLRPFHKQYLHIVSVVRIKPNKTISYPVLYHPLRVMLSRVLASSSQ